MELVSDVPLIKFVSRFTYLFPRAFGTGQGRPTFGSTKHRIFSFAAPQILAWIKLGKLNKRWKGQRIKGRRWPPGHNRSFGFTLRCFSSNTGCTSYWPCCYLDVVSQLLAVLTNVMYDVTGIMCTNSCPSDISNVFLWFFTTDAIGWWSFPIFISTCFSLSKPFQGYHITYSLWLANVIYMLNNIKNQRLEPGEYAEQ